MRLRDNAKLRSLRQLEGPTRLSALVKMLDDDLAVILAIPTPPAAVQKTIDDYQAARTVALGVLEDIAATEAAERQAHEQRVKAAAAALREGKSLKAPAVPAQGAAAVIGVQAAEALLGDAHAALLDATRDAWPEWRRALIDESAAAHRQAADAISAASAAVGEASRFYNGVGTLDAELRARYPEIERQTDTELRDGLPWYAATHAGQRPLKSVRVRGCENALLIDDVLAGLTAAAAETDFAAADWLPPADPEHDAMARQPLDPSTPWVKAAVIRQAAGLCALCQIWGADAAQRLNERLVAVHRSCADQPPTETARRRAQRMARMASGAEPFPTPPWP